MSTKHSLNSLGLVGIFAAAIFVVAFALLMVVGGYGVMASFFMAFLIALLAAIILFLGLGNPASQTEPLNRGAASGDGASASSGASSGAAPAAAAAGAAAAASTSDDDAAARAAAAADAEKAAAQEAERKAAEDARERQAAEEEAARKAAAEAEAADAEAKRRAEAEAADAEAKRQAEAEAARAKAEADAKAAADAEAARKAAEASSAPATDADGIPDYDGDGKLEGVNEGTRPAGLDAPRDGKADDLKQIKGVGPKMEKLCNSLGFWHFDQIAAWTSDEVAWVDANLQGFKGRVTRDTWVEQARILAGGGETEFSKRVEDGDVY